MDAEGNHRAGYPLGKLPSRGVVLVKHPTPALGKQLGLGLAVGPHGAVKVQMVPGEVGEDPLLKGESRRPLQGQCVGRDFHHHMGTACRLHLCQQAVECVGIRRGALGWKGLGANEILVGADEAHLGPQHPLQHGF